LTDTEWLSTFSHPALPIDTSLQQSVQQVIIHTGHHLQLTHKLALPLPPPLLLLPPTTPTLSLPAIPPTLLVAAVKAGKPFAQCNVGANISVTPHITLLDDVTTLANVEHIAGADSWSSHMVCTQGGWFMLYFDDQPPARVFMIYCPDISNTIISPQHMSKHQHSPFDGFTITARRDGTTCIQFIFMHSNRVATATLFRQADLFYFMQLPTATIIRASRLSAIDAELWHQRLGHPGATQLAMLHKHMTDFPSGVHSAAHRFMTCTSCMDARHQRSAAGPVQDTAPLVNGQQYHVNFGFMCASS
jgi:hypothetical protein